MQTAKSVPALVLNAAKPSIFITRFLFSSTVGKPGTLSLLETAVEMLVAILSLLNCVWNCGFGSLRHQVSEFLRKTI